MLISGLFLPAIPANLDFKAIKASKKDIFADVLFS